MTLKLPDDTQRIRIVVQIAGPVSRLHLRHVPSDWVIFTTSHGPDREAGVAKLRHRAEKNGYTVEPGYAIEDANAKIRGMMTS